MSKKQNGPANGGGGAVSGTERTASHSTHKTSNTGPEGFQEYASLGPLAPRLIPLCRPTDDGGCTCPTHVGTKGHDSKSSGKAPIQQGWQKHDHVPRWPNYPYNVGVRLGRALAILDIDPKSGGRENLARLETVHGKLPRIP